MTTKEIEALKREIEVLIQQCWNKINTEMDRRAKEYEQDQIQDFVTAALPF